MHPREISPGLESAMESFFVCFDLPAQEVLCHNRMDAQIQNEILANMWIQMNACAHMAVDSHTYYDTHAFRWQLKYTHTCIGMHSIEHIYTELRTTWTKTWSPGAFALLFWCTTRKNDAATPGKVADGDNICDCGDYDGDRVRTIKITVKNNSILLAIHFLVLPIMTGYQHSKIIVALLSCVNPSGYWIV